MADTTSDKSQHFLLTLPICLGLVDAVEDIYSNLHISYLRREKTLPNHQISVSSREEDQAGFVRRCLDLDKQVNLPARELSAVADD